MTAAAAAAICGWDVCIFDEHGNDVLSFAGAQATKRWLHPHIYEWPVPQKDRADAGLCILDWRAGPVHEVVEPLRRQWSIIRDQFGIKVHLSASAMDVSRLGTGYLLKWNGPPPTGAAGNVGPNVRRMYLRNFDAVILAVGFGKETATEGFPNVISYWEADNIDGNRTAGSREQHVLVSGTGDGGLIDVLRYSFLGFRHDTVLDSLKRRWLRPERFEELQLFAEGRTRCHQEKVR